MFFRRFVLSCLIFVVAFASAQTNPVPYVNQPLVPASVAPGHAGFTLTVSGANFVPGAAVLWNGHARQTRFVSSHMLQAKIIIGDVTQAGTASVTVHNPHSTVASNPVYFPIRASSPTVTTVQDTNFTAPSSAFAFVTGDFNNDGNLDVAAARFYTDGAGIAVYLGNGDGTFQAPKISRPGVEFNAFVVGDFNGDGRPDLAASFPYLCPGCGGAPSYVLNIYLGSGDGYFKETPQTKRRFGLPMAAADFNGDGKLDLITGSTDYSGQDWYVDLYLGSGDGRLLQETGIVDTYINSIPAIGDFNGDGKLDFAINAFDALYGDQLVYVFMGKGDGSFQAPASYPSTFYRAGYLAVSADLNGDGILDLASDSGEVLLGNGDGTFTHDANANFEGITPGGIAVGDLNGDAKLDTVMNGLNYTGQTLVLLGNNDGTFAPVAVTGSGEVLGAFDFNNDGELDILTSTGLFLQTP